MKTYYIIFFFCGKQVRRKTSLMYREIIIDVLVFFTLLYCFLLYKILTELITIMRPPQSKSRPLLNAPVDHKPSINTFKPNKGSNCLVSLEFEPELCRLELNILLLYQVYSCKSNKLQEPIFFKKKKAPSLNHSRQVCFYSCHTPVPTMS